MEIRRSQYRLISTMGFSILMRWYIDIESSPVRFSVAAGCCCCWFLFLFCSVLFCFQLAGVFQPRCNSPELISGYEVSGKLTFRPLFIKYTFAFTNARWDIDNSGDPDQYRVNCRSSALYFAFLKISNKSSLFMACGIRHVYGYHKTALRIPFSFKSTLF